MSPLIFVIFGATGDLTSRKLMPAIFSLIKDQKLSPDILIIGVGRRKLSNDDFREVMKKAAHVTESQKDRWDALEPNIRYVQGFFEQDDLYTTLVTTLEAYDTKMGACIPRFFYLATPPEHYEGILMHLRDSKLAEGCGQGTVNYTRVLIEKPFGKDLETAKHLDELLATIFEERQIYRIDHYLAKETTQNILAFRFANGIFEPTWNKNFIDHVQITVAEDIGVETRGPLYEGIGAIRDVMQNHMMQMLSLVAMEQPRAFDEASIRSARAKVVSAIPAITTKRESFVIRGQYEGYRQEKGVLPESVTDTFVAMELFIDSERWKGVPFYLRTGKKMPRQVTEISLHYKKPALCYDDVCLFDPNKVFRNVLTIRVQPDERVSFRQMVKKPGFGMELVPVEMEYEYSNTFSNVSSPDAYEKLLMDAIIGDQTLFARTDEIEASWRILEHLLVRWKESDTNLLFYKPGTWGPPASDVLIEKDDRKWYLSEK